MDQQTTDTATIPRRYLEAASQLRNEHAQLKAELAETRANLKKVMDALAEMNSLNERLLDTLEVQQKRLTEVRQVPASPWNLHTCCSLPIAGPHHPECMSAQQSITTPIGYTWTYQGMRHFTGHRDVAEEIARTAMELGVPVEVHPVCVVGRAIGKGGDA